MKVLRTFFLCVLVIAFAASLSAQSRVRDRIARRIEESSTTPVPGNVHPLASSEHDRGRVSRSFRLEQVTMVFKPTEAQQAELDQLMHEQQDPASANYRRWLSPDEFADRFGLSANDVSKVAAWLESRGLTVRAVARNRRAVRFSGSANQIESAFGTSIHEY